MVKVDIVIVRSNAIVNSPRVIKINRSLTKKYSVLVIGWNRERLSQAHESTDVLRLRLFQLKAPIGRKQLILYLPLYWIYIFANLLKHRPTIVHACDLDTVFPCFIYTKLLRKSIIFDVCDRYAMSKIINTRSFIYRAVNRIEEYYAKNVDVLINVSKKLEDTFAIKPKNAEVIMNCANPDDIHLSDKTDSAKYSRGTDTEFVKGNLVKLVYTGNIIRKRGLEGIAQAIDGLEGIRLVLAGRVSDQKLLNDLVKTTNIDYKGSLNLNDALSLEASSDIMVILYDPSVPNNKYSMPNKLFEAMMFGLPVITNVAPEIVDACRCGIFVEYNNVKAIKNAIISLRDDPLLRSELGQNGKISFQTQYNWNEMERRLLHIYEDLFHYSRF